MKQIAVPIAEVWEYFVCHKSSLCTKPQTIAENPEFGVEIIITVNNEDLLTFIVTADNSQLREETVVSKTACESVLKELYEDYLTEKFIYDSLKEPDEDDDSLTQEDMISERELELDDAVLTLLDVIIEEDGSLVLGASYDEIVEDVKEHILEYVARKHELSIRRPMILEDTETGDDFFTEYPYECMEFDDEDNPMYK